MQKQRVKSRQKRKSSIRRSNAIVALEGYKPTKLDRELDSQFISGRITRSQAIARINREARILAKKSRSHGLVGA
ncbi:MAG: antitoxin VbhA family protein [Chthoniobacterales bacterium]|nr:antitoxin VbhA family protein [Chthoniobacterales bacterium]